MPKKGSKCPDEYGHTRAGTNPGDRDHYFTDNSKRETTTENIHNTSPRLKVESHFNEITRKMNEC